MYRPIPAQTKIAARRIGDNIATWRKLYGITSQQLADKAAVSRAPISRLENGDPSVSFATFLNVCRAVFSLADLTDAPDPYATDSRRIRPAQALPQRVRTPH